nr:uncharacterized protein LOC128670938 isoform X2 [Plodia interpunctella]
MNLDIQAQGALLYETENLGATDNRTEPNIIKVVRKNVMELWLNFICEGAPVPLGSTLPTWPPANAEGYPLMSIGQSLVLLGPQEERRHRMKFWHKIYDRYYRDPIPPPDRSSRVEL